MCMQHVTTVHTTLGEKGNIVPQPAERACAADALLVSASTYSIAGWRSSALHHEELHPSIYHIASSAVANMVLDIARS
jgi:hypothetical protein